MQSRAWVISRGPKCLIWVASSRRHRGSDYVALDGRARPEADIASIEIRCQIPGLAHYRLRLGFALGLKFEGMALECMRFLARATSGNDSIRFWGLLPRGLHTGPWRRRCNCGQGRTPVRSRGARQAQLSRLQRRRSNAPSSYSATAAAFVRAAVAGRRRIWLAPKSHWLIASDPFHCGARATKIYTTYVFGRRMLYSLNGKRPSRPPRTQTPAHGLTSERDCLRAF